MFTLQNGFPCALNFSAITAKKRCARTAIFLGKRATQQKSAKSLYNWIPQTVMI